MQLVTLIGLALCSYELYRRARKARNQQPSNTKKRFKTAHLLLGALVAWLVISIQLQHLDKALGGEPEPESTWERVVQTVSEWL